MMLLHALPRAQRAFSLAHWLLCTGPNNSHTDNYRKATGKHPLPSGAHAHCSTHLSWSSLHTPAPMHRTSPPQTQPQEEPPKTRDTVDLTNPDAGMTAGTDTPPGTQGG